MLTYWIQHRHNIRTPATEIHWKREKNKDGSETGKKEKYPNIYIYTIVIRTYQYVPIFYIFYCQYLVPGTLLCFIHTTRKPSSIRRHLANYRELIYVSWIKPCGLQTAKMNCDRDVVKGADITMLFHCRTGHDRNNGSQPR